MTLTNLMESLDRLSSAAFRDDLTAYRSALATCHDIGATRAQIADAYFYGIQRRLNTTSLPVTSFDVRGEC